VKDNTVKIIQMDQRMICSDIDGRGKGMMHGTRQHDMQQRDRQDCTSHSAAATLVT